MVINNILVISFEIPKEYEMQKDFEKTFRDISKWTKMITKNCIYYTRNSMMTFEGYEAMADYINRKGADKKGEEK